MSQTFAKDWPARYRLPVRNYPNVWQAGPVSSTLGDLGCNCSGNCTQCATLGSLDGLGSLGACPQTASVYVEDNAIPQWVWLIAAVWGGLMLLKKR
jgi:hypothetical protein